MARPDRYVAALCTSLACVFVVGCTSPDGTLRVDSAEVTNAGGLRVVIDQPCPEGGAINIAVEEAPDEIVVTASWSDSQLRDCDGGAAHSDQRTTAILLSTSVGDRPVIDGSTGAEVPTTRP